MIDALPLKTLRNGEFNQFMHDVVGLVNAADPEALYLRPQFEALNYQYQQIEALFGEPKGSKLTRALVAADKRRDEAIVGLRFTIKGATYHYQPERKAAAVLLLNQMTRFSKSFTNENAPAKTAILRNIADAWSEDARLAAAVQLLGLDEWKMELEAANDLFGDLFLQRDQELSARGKQNLSNLRITATIAYYDLRNKLQAWHTAQDGAEPWGRLVVLLNVTIRNYNRLLARRAGKAEDTALVGVDTVGAEGQGEEI